MPRSDPWLPRVYTTMLLQQTGLRKALVADRARVRQVSRVLAYVDFENGLAGEGARTVRALIRTFTGMLDAMLSQSLGCGE